MDNDQEVIAWLRSGEGILWSRDHHVSACRHQHGIFAEEKPDVEHCVTVDGPSSACPCNMRVHHPDYNTMQIAGEIATNLISEEDEDFDLIDRGNNWLRSTFKVPEMLTGFGLTRRSHP
jgi:hypothetical protein